MNELITALIKARLEFKPIAKEKVNPFHKSKYAPLDSVLSATESALSKHGLTIVQTVDVVEGRTLLITTLYHTSGQNVASRYPLPAIDDPQKVGAAMTYGRRYSICAILSVTADEDDDGNAASAKTKPKAEPKPEPATPTNTDRIKAAMPAGWEGKQVTELITKLFPPKTKSKDLTNPEVDQLIEAMRSAA